jgi:GntR family transcriptional regulator/MocR family aminotransferase
MSAPSHAQEPVPRAASALVDDAGAARQQWGAFTPGVPEVRLFPIAVSGAACRPGCGARRRQQHLSYATGAGDPDLRSQPGRLPAREPAASPVAAEQIVITGGTQQSLHLVAQLLADPGRHGLARGPGLLGRAQRVARPGAAGWSPVPLDSEGMAPDAAPAVRAAAGAVRVALAPVPDSVR